MTAPQEVTGAEAEAHPEAVTAGMGEAIQGRSLGQIAWRRLRRDKVALGGGRRDRPADPGRDLRSADRRGAGPRPARVPLRPGRSRPADLAEVLRRHQPDLPLRRRAGQRARRLQPRRLRRPHLAAHRVLRHAARGAGRHGPGRRRGLLRRLDRHADQPHDGRVPGLPDPAVRARAGRDHPGPGVRPAGRRAADRAHHRDHRLLQLALHRPDHPRPDALAARARVRRRRPQPRRAQRRGSCSPSCCPTSSRRSSCTPRC